MKWNALSLYKLAFGAATFGLEDARGVLRLFRQVAGIFQDRQPPVRSGVRFVDSKLRRKLRQKKAALGQKPGGAAYFPFVSQGQE